MGAINLDAELCVSKCRTTFINPVQDRDYLPWEVSYI